MIVRHIALTLTLGAILSAQPSNWTRHVIADAFRTNTAVAADFTGDGRIDVIANSGKQDILFVAPAWKRVVLGTTADSIHSAVLDMDGDGDPDFVGAQYQPGYIYWLERPKDPLTQTWNLHVVDDGNKGGVNGVHGLAIGDVNKDGKPDLIGNSAQPKGAFPNSLAWFAAPKWSRHIFAVGDAPGLSHYLGFGDVNGDGRPDLASGAKIAEGGNWFAWWEAPKDPTQAWKKHVIAENQVGATNIFMTDVNKDGKMDFLASRGHGKGLVWYEGPNWKAHDIDTVHRFPHSLAIGDIDQDGDIDAVTCSAVYKGEAPPVGSNEGGLAWFKNDGKGGFTTMPIFKDQAAYDIRLVDMDKDGDLDVLVAGQESENVVWYENRLSR